MCLKETTVERLSENASQADFKRWIKELYMHLENAGWRGVTAIMKRVRMVEYPTKGVSQEIIDEVHADTDNDFNQCKLDVNSIDGELYNNLIRKLNKHMSGLVINLTSGFEDFRMVGREIDPITKGTKIGLQHQFMNLNQPRGASNP